MGCSTSLAKTILFIFNIAFFLFGVVSLSLGIWVIASRSELFRFINLIDNRVSDSSNKADIDNIANQHGLVEMAGRVLIGLGLLTLVIGFCGCCGAMKESKVLLTLYVILVGLVLILQLTAAIMAAIFRNRVQHEASQALKSLQDRFFVSLPQYQFNNNSAQSSVTYMINYMHVTFDCCGAVTAGDAANSSSWISSERNFNGKQLMRPITCCRMKDKNAVINPSFNWNSFNESMLVDPDCPFETDNDKIHLQTCYTGITNYVSHFATPLIITCVAIALIEMVGIICGCCLIKAVDNDKNYAK